jgi:hypothetical protein
VTTVKRPKPWLVRIIKLNYPNQTECWIDVKTISWIEVDKVSGEHQSVLVNFTNGRESMHVTAAPDELQRLEQAFVDKYYLGLA